MDSMEDLWRDEEEDERDRQWLEAFRSVRLALSSRNVSLSRKFRREEPDAWWTETIERVREGDVEAIRFMKENDLLDEEDWDRLMVRALFTNLPIESRVELCRMACQAGSHLRPMILDNDEYERKPLALACALSFRESPWHRLVQVFLDQPFCPVNDMDSFGRTALHCACNSTIPDPLVISMLLEHGADPCAQDDDGNTPLHHLVSKTNLDGCELLLSKKKECLLLRDSLGNLPLYCLLISMITIPSRDFRVQADDKLQLFLEEGGESLRELFLSIEEEPSRAPPMLMCLESFESAMSMFFAYGYILKGRHGSKEPTEAWKRMERIHGWTNSKHHRYPSRFRDAIRTLFLSRKRHEKVGGPLGKLDRFLFMHIVRHVSWLDWIGTRHRFEFGPWPSE